MARIKIDLPQQFKFSTSIAIRITDLNYGGHVGNDSILSIIHEARVQFLRSFGYQELDMQGVGLIMSDVSIEFKSELFYGKSITAWVAAGEFTSVAFALYYKLELQSSEGEDSTLIAVAKSNMVCFDYRKKKIVPVPSDARTRLMH